MRKLEKDARQSPEKKPKQSEIRAPRIPFEPVPLHVPVHMPEPRRNDRREESISEPRGVVIIDYGE